jgi:uroporphyrinogen-III synthase
MTTEKPTTAGVIEMLSRLDLARHRIGVQLYPDKDHSALLAAIAAHGATAIPVTPYIYDARAADSHVVTAIEEMAEGRIDAIALTNLGQIRRLFDVARTKGLEARLREGLEKTPIASVGPAVSDELASHGLSADIYPEGDAFFMRPLISAMAVALARKKPRVAR